MTFTFTDRLCPFIALWIDKYETDLDMQTHAEMVWTGLALDVGSVFSCTQYVGDMEIVIAV